MLQADAAQILRVSTVTVLQSPTALSWMFGASNSRDRGVPGGTGNAKVLARSRTAAPARVNRSAAAATAACAVATLSNVVRELVGRTERRPGDPGQPQAPSSMRFRDTRQAAGGVERPIQ
jgi:hypothetical protein